MIQVMRNNVYLNCSESHMAGFVRWVTAHSYAKAGVFLKKCEEEEETPEQMDTDSVVNRDCDEEDHDAPLVHIEKAIGGTSCFTNNEAVNHPTLAQAAVLRCRCKQIQTIAEAGLEPEQRRGCISQFTDQEVLTLQLSIGGMTKGKTGKCMDLSLIHI